jgi:ribonuclease PH
MAALIDAAIPALFDHLAEEDRPPPVHPRNHRDPRLTHLATGTTARPFAGAVVPIAFNAAGASAANASVVRHTVGSETQPLTGTVAAVSVGIVGGVPLLDLAYEEDVTAGLTPGAVCAGADGGGVPCQVNVLKF